MVWEILYVEEDGISSTEKWLDLLPKEAFKSIAKELKLLELTGNQLRLPHSRALGDNLFELRERNYGYRIYYTFQSQQAILVLLTGNKNTQERDIKIARKKLSQLNRRQYASETV